MSSWPSVASATAPFSPAGHLPTREPAMHPGPLVGPGRARLRRTVAAAAALIVMLLVTTGCLGSMPRDSQGTLDRATGGVLRVGVSEHPPFTVVGENGDVSGEEVDLIQQYAAGIDARIEWTAGPESVLSEAMKNGDLDVVIGGFTADAPGPAPSPSPAPTPPWNGPTVRPRRW